MKTKSALIADIIELYGTVGDRFGIDMAGDEDGDAERDFLVARCPERLEATVRTLPTLSMHLLATIAEGAVSVVGLASRSGRLKGTVSKHVQRLVAAGLVDRMPIPGNRKEIQLAPTGDGEVLVDAHRQLHREMAGGMSDFLSAYRTADLEVLATVLRDLLSATRTGVRLVRG